MAKRKKRASVITQAEAENAEQHIILIRQHNLGALLDGQPMLLDGKAFGIKKPVCVVFAETLEEANKQFSHKRIVEVKTEYEGEHA